MITLFEYALGAVVMAVDVVLRILPMPVSGKRLQRLEEAANAFRRLRLLRKYHPELLEHARRVPVKCLSSESFNARHKRDPYDSRGLLLFASDGVFYWDLGQSTRLEPCKYRAGDTRATLHLKEPYRQGEQVWVQVESDGVSRYFQGGQDARANEATRTLYAEIQAALHESSGSE